MIKKIIFSSAFLVGGYFLIKKLLPSGNLQAVSSDDFEPEVYTPKESILRYGGGGASRYVQDNIRTRMEFGTQTLRNKELNDPSWGFNPYDAPSSGDYIKGGSRGLVL